MSASAPHCNTQELEAILVESSNGMTMLPSRAMDEVYPGLYVGDASSAHNIGVLKNHGITHVINCALGTDRWHVNTNRETYQKEDITFLGIEATDENCFKLNKYFEKSAHFIDDAIRKNGKVLVHCHEGASRSATLAVVYLMTKCHMTVQEAMRLVRSKREVCPNDGFLQQLCDLNETLWQEEHYKPKQDKQAGTVDQ